MNALVKPHQLDTQLSAIPRPLSKPQKNRLRFKSPKKHCPDFFTLPFVGKDHGEFSYWDVPLTTGFLPGTYLGSALALIYLNYIRDSDYIVKHVLLGDISAAWLDKARSCTPEEHKALLGQMKGFLGKINPCQPFSSWPGEAADASQSNESLIEQANRWLEIGSDDTLLSMLSSATEQPAKE